MLPKISHPSLTFKGKNIRESAKKKENNYVFQIGLRQTISQLIFIYIYILYSSIRLLYDR